MNAVAFAPWPIAQHAFRPPEIWIILKAMQVLVPHVETPPEFKGGKAGEAAIQKQLIEQGILKKSGRGRARLAPEVEALILPAVLPELALLVSVSRTVQAGGAAGLVCFNWTSGTVVVNWVDEHGDHHFEAYEPDDLQACVLEFLWRAGGMDVEEPAEVPEVPSAEAFERIAGRMTRMVSLLAVAGLRGEKQNSRALGWIVSDRSAWLMQAGAVGGEGVLSQVGAAQLALAVFDLVQQALDLIPHTTPAAAPAQ